MQQRSGRVGGRGRVGAWAMVVLLVGAVACTPGASERPAGFGADGGMNLLDAGVPGEGGAQAGGRIVSVRYPSDAQCATSYEDCAAANDFVLLGLPDGQLITCDTDEDRARPGIQRTLAVQGVAWNTPASLLPAALGDALRCDGGCATYNEEALAQLASTGRARVTVRSGLLLVRTGDFGGCCHALTLDVDDSRCASQGRW